VAQVSGPFCEVQDVGFLETTFPTTNTMAKFQERVREPDPAAAAEKET
jgi:hypothetical protein